MAGLGRAGQQVLFETPFSAMKFVLVNSFD